MPAIIVAYERNRGIGNAKGELLYGPYEMATDKARFRTISRQMGTVIIGRKSLLDEQISLDRRPFAKVEQVIVVTHQPTLDIPGIEIAHSLAQAISMAHRDPLIAGGASIYAQALDPEFPYPVDTIYATEIEADLPHDPTLRFPELPATQWRAAECREVPAGRWPDHPRKHDRYPSREVTYRRRSR